MKLRAAVEVTPWRTYVPIPALCAALFAGLGCGTAVSIALRYSALGSDLIAFNALFYTAFLVVTLTALWIVPPRGDLAGKLGLRGFRKEDLPAVFSGLFAIYLFQLTVTPLWSGALRAFGVKYAESQNFVSLCRNAGAAEFSALVLLAGALIPLTEEVVFRRLLFGVLRPLGGLPALLLSSLVFSVLHFFLYGFWALWFLGGVLQLVYLVTGNLATAVAAHMLFNLITLTAVFCMGAA